MGCGCGKKLPRAARIRAEALPSAPPPPDEVTTFLNASDSVVSSRNPRLTIQPGEIVELTEVERHSYVVKMAIRNEELVGLT
jgi:hypothetical protein